MRAYRIALAVPGAALLAFGVFRLVTELEGGDLLALVLWMAVAVALHDGIVAPATVGTGLLLTRVPPRARRYLQGAVLVGALTTVIAIPLIGREGSQPRSKAILLRDYAGNLTLLLALTAATGLVVYALRVVRDQRRGGAASIDGTPR